MYMCVHYNYKCTCTCILHVHVSLQLCTNVILCVSLITSMCVCVYMSHMYVHVYVCMYTCTMYTRPYMAVYQLHVSYNSCKMLFKKRRRFLVFTFHYQMHSWT